METLSIPNQWPKFFRCYAQQLSIISASVLFALSLAFQRPIFAANEWQTKQNNRTTAARALLPRGRCRRACSVKGLRTNFYPTAVLIHLILLTVYFYISCAALPNSLFYKFTTHFLEKCSLAANRVHCRGHPLQENFDQLPVGAPRTQCSFWYTVSCTASRHTRVALPHVCTGPLSLYFNLNFIPRITNPSPAALVGTLRKPTLVPAFCSSAHSRLLSTIPFLHFVLHSAVRTHLGGPARTPPSKGSSKSVSLVVPGSADSLSRGSSETISLKLLTVLGAAF